MQTSLDTAEKIISNLKINSNFAWIFKIWLFQEEQNLLRLQPPHFAIKQKTAITPLIPKQLSLIFKLNLSSRSITLKSNKTYFAFAIGKLNFSCLFIFVKFPATYALHHNISYKIGNA